MPATPHPGKSDNVDDPAPFGRRGPPPINPPLVALALAIVFLLALLVAVLLDGDPAAADDPPTKEAEMTEGKPATGTPDEQYDLVSVLYHALQGGETSQCYVDDARKAGDGELATFLEQVQAEDRDRAERAKRLLATRLQLAVR